MSDEATPDMTWEEITDSWRLDELLEGRMQPTTSDDVLTLMTIGALRDRRPPLSEAARRKAFDVMMAAADGGAGAEGDQAQAARRRAAAGRTGVPSTRAPSLTRA